MNRLLVVVCSQFTNSQPKPWPNPLTVIHLPNTRSPKLESVQNVKEGRGSSDECKETQDSLLRVPGDNDSDPRSRRAITDGGLWPH